jgi:hypothetical protein
MTYQLILKNPVLNDLADQCGVIIATENREATAFEIEFFAEEIVRKCLEILEDGHSPSVHDSDANFYSNTGRREAAAEIRNHFGVDCD